MEEFEEMEETREDGGAGPSNSNSNLTTTTWWPSEFIDKFGSVSLGSQQDESLSNNSNSRTSSRFNSVVNHNNQQHELSASQTLWSTGMLTDPIPNGFYSVIPNWLTVKLEKLLSKDLDEEQSAKKKKRISGGG